MCEHCGARSVESIGSCDVCNAPVCRSCGNPQYAKGVRRVRHNACLQHDRTSFSMIKFAR